MTFVNFIAFVINPNIEINNLSIKIKIFFCDVKKPLPKLDIARKIGKMCNRSYFNNPIC
jgi:hypothetical protein